MRGPITLSEFSSLLHSCRPPTGWPTVLGVAFSGGADSLCLLYLLRSLFQSADYNQFDCLKDVYALTVDHQLQAASTKHAEHCATWAKQLNIQHTTYKIKWGEGIMPPHPKPMGPLEETARDVRYHGLFSSMRQSKLNMIAMGHHLDDQAETLLMNFNRGSLASGLAGMRRCRRWGMGIQKPGSKYTFFGLEGMRSWVIRPLLSIPKKRIIETCEHHQMQYVEDSTNFQPDLTPRNRIRHELAHLENMTLASSHLVQGYNNSNLVPSLPDVNTIDDLYEHVNYWERSRDEVEIAADEYVRIARVPSPESTFCLAMPLPHGNHVFTNTIILRVLRYVSPLPWGSPAAEGGRKRDSLSRIAANLKRMEDPRARLQPFTCGGRVLWTPMTVAEDNTLRELQKDQENSRIAWLASRLPPFRYERPSPVDVNISAELKGALSSNRFHILWDNRFKITCDVSGLDTHTKIGVKRGTTNVWIKPKNKYFEPTVTLLDPTMNKWDLEAELIKIRRSFHFEGARSLERL